jgi:uncharacterized protein YggL (DUF469 family)
MAAALVAQLRATLSRELDPKASRKILHSLEDKVFVPGGLYLDGGLTDSTDPSRGPEIAGLLTRADGRDLTERERKRVEAWLASIPQIIAFSVGPLQPANAPEDG